MDMFYIYFLHESLNNSSSGRNLTNTTHTWTLKPSQISSHSGREKRNKVLVCQREGQRALPGIVNCECMCGSRQEKSVLSPIPQRGHQRNGDPHPEKRMCS